MPLSNITGRSPILLRGFFYVVIGYHLIAIAALVITGGYEFEAFGVSVTSNRLYPLITGLCIGAVLLLTVHIGAVNSLLMFISAGVTFGLCEWGLRILNPPIAQAALMQIHQPSDQMGYELRPSSEGYGNLGEFIQINSFGARDREFGPKHSEIRRVVVIGDSFTFGFGVALEDTYVKQLEALLAQRLGQVEVLNLGVTAYQTWQLVEQLEGRVADLDPDLVIIGFFLDDMVAPIKPDVVQARNPAEAWNAGKESTFTTGKLIRNLGKQLEYLIRHQRGREYLHSIETRRAYIEAEVPDRFALQTGNIDSAWSAQIDHSLEVMAQWSNTTSTPLMGLYIPDASQVNQPDLQFINGRLADVFAQFNLEFVDSTPAFEAHSDVRKLYLFPLDAHTNDLGHRLIAEQLAASEFLQRVLITP